MIRNIANVVGFVLIVVLGSSAAFSQTYPNKEIHAICPFPPANGADLIVRYYAGKLAELSGKAVITENRPGANGIVGTEAVARAKPDGYTIGISPVSSILAAGPHVMKKLPFDPLNDFELIGTLLTVAFVVVVNPSKPVQTISELTKYLKEKKGGSFYGGASNNSIIASELYKKAIGVDVQRVNYRTPVDALNDLASGSIDFYITDVGSALPHIAAGRYRALAIVGAKRTSSLPDIPTMIESGIPVEIPGGWWGGIAPARTPKPIIDKLTTWFEQISALPATTEFIKTYGFDLMAENATTARALLVHDTELWGEYVRRAGFEPQ